MTRYRIPRAGGMGFDTIDTGATDAAIAALQSTVDELKDRLAAVEGQPVAKSASSFEPAGAVAAHVAATDPHPQYLTAAEGAAAYEALGAVAAHAAAADPHSAYLLEAAFTWTNLGSKPTSFVGLGITDGSLPNLFTSYGTDAGFVTYDRSNGTDSWTLYASENSFHVYSGNGGLNVWSVARTTGHMSLPVAASEFYRAAANSTTTTRQPRIWVGGSDPGAAAADGDLWLT